jgi:hypothetical protein
MHRSSTRDLGALLIGQPELSEQVMRALDLKGDLPQMLDVGYQPVIIAEDLTAPEFRWLRRNARLSQGITIAAVAAQFSQGAFAPLASARNTLAVVEKLILANLAAASASFLIDSQPNITVGAAPGIPRTALDDRSIPTGQLQPAPSFGLVSATAAAGLTAAGAIIVAVPAGSTLVLDLNWVFTARQVLTTPAPSLLLVQSGNVNTQIQFSVVWRERTLLSSETQPGV